MKRLFKQLMLAALVLSLILSWGTALADIAWPAASTQGQVQLQGYIQRVNANLAELNRAPVNTLFELYTFTASLGITDQDQAEVPEGVELSFTMYRDALNQLVLRVSDTDRFTDIAAACIQAAAPEAITLEKAKADPAAYAKKASRNPNDSMKDTVDELNGDMVRTYFAYYPNQYHDGVNWLEMTLIFPIGGMLDVGVTITPVPENSTKNVEHEGYYQEDDGAAHLEVFVTNTPEPGSPAWDEYTNP